MISINDDGTSAVDQAKIAQIAMTRGGSAPAFSVSPKGGNVVYARSRVQQPAELERTEIGSSPAGHGESVPARLTNHSAALVTQLDLQPAESFEFPGADGDRVQGWLVRPPGFDPAKKYPVVFSDTRWAPGRVARRVAQSLEL